MRRSLGYALGVLLAAVLFIVLSPEPSTAAGVNQSVEMTSKPVPFDVQFNTLQQFVERSDIHAALKVSLLVLLDEASALRGDPEGFIETTNAVAEALLDPVYKVSSAFVSDFVSRYASVFGKATEIEWDWDFDPASSCNKNFECVWDLAWGCLRVWWKGPNGSGGINCISR